MKELLEKYILLQNKVVKRNLLLKKIEKKRFTRNPKARKYLDNEINILKILNHPNVVKLYTIKETLQDIFIVTEFCNGGDLSNCLEEQKIQKSFSRKYSSISNETNYFCNKIFA